MICGLLDDNVQEPFLRHLLNLCLLVSRSGMKSTGWPRGIRPRSLPASCASYCRCCLRARRSIWLAEPEGMHFSWQGRAGTSQRWIGLVRRYTFCKPALRRDRFPCAVPTDLPRAQCGRDGALRDVHAGATGFSGRPAESGLSAGLRRAAEGVSRAANAFLPRTAGGAGNCELGGGEEVLIPMKMPGASSATTSLSCTVCRDGLQSLARLRIL